jgi:hypothetical protein
MIAGPYPDASYTKGADDIYVNQQLLNFLDSKCTHFEQKRLSLKKTSMSINRRSRNNYTIISSG